MCSAIGILNWLQWWTCVEAKGHGAWRGSDAVHPAMLFAGYAVLQVALPGFSDVHGFSPTIGRAGDAKAKLSGNAQCFTNTCKPNKV